MYDIMIAVSYMNERFSRSVALYKEKGFEKIQSTSVIIFGAGGVGGYVIEALSRSGIGSITIVDNDTFSKSNLNRQILSLESTLSKSKTQVAKDRIKEINPDCNVTALDMFFTKDNAHEIDFSQYDYIIDAIDTVSSKLELVKIANDKNIPIISSMGTGNKTHPEMLEIADIYKTSVCPLARAMRKLCKENRIKKLMTVYSKEQPIVSGIKTDEQKKVVPASGACVPAAAGILIASYVINDILAKTE